MLDIRDGTPDLRHKRRCEMTLYLLTHSKEEKATGSVQVALALAMGELEDESTFSFEATKYGPRVPDFDKIQSSLVDEGLLEETVTGRNDANAVVVPAGIDHTFDSLSSKEKQCLEWVAKKHLVRSGALISFMYRQYPEYFEEMQ